MHRYRAAFRAWRSYRGAGLRTRAFLAARLAVLPLKPLADEFAQLHGRVLGVGSGHGLIARWIAELNPDVTVDGSDVDERRIAVAAATQELAPRVRILHRDVRALDDVDAYDAAEATDLMHHVPSEEHADVARAIARALRPGGVVLIKDIACTPRWKHAFNSLHDRLVTGKWENFSREPEAMAAVFEAAGLETERCYRVAPLSPYPHFILRARRPAAPSG